MPRPTSQVNAPAALKECRSQGYQWTYGRHCGTAGARFLAHERVHPQGRPTPKLAGDRPKYRRAPPQELDFVSGTLRSYFLPWQVLLSLGLLCVWEVVARLGFGWYGLWLYGDGDRGLPYTVELSFYGSELMGFFCVVWLRAGFFWSRSRQPLSPGNMLPLCSSVSLGLPVSCSVRSCTAYPSCVFHYGARNALESSRWSSLRSYRSGMTVELV